MIYLIGGAPRTGKSGLVQQLITRKPISSLSTDFLYDLDQVRAITNFDKLDVLKKGEVFFPILERIIGNIQRQSENCVIDGDVILPRHADFLSKKYEIRACFLGLSEASIEEIIQHGGHFNWPKYKLENGMAKDVEGLVERTIQKSEIIASECVKYDQYYLDLSADFTLGQARALRYLLDS